MVYKVIGLMSGSSLDGLDMVYTHLHAAGGKWSYEIMNTHCAPYSKDWEDKLANAVNLSARDYQVLHTAYGRWVGAAVNEFITAHHLEHKVDLVASHGHTTFHLPARQTTAQLGDGATIAAVTGLPVVSDLRAMDLALGGQGAPIVPIGEKLLLPEYPLLLNLGGIANISLNLGEQTLAFDVCPANRVLNLLAQQVGQPYDDAGKLAASGNIHHTVLQQLNSLEYYRLSAPKSLANEFGTSTVFPLLSDQGVSVPDALATFVEHISFQVQQALQPWLERIQQTPAAVTMLVTGGGAFNTFLVESIRREVEPLGVSVVVPDAALVNYKEALVMALIGVLRWREEYNVLASVTGAVRNSINGALWLGSD